MSDVLKSTESIEETEPYLKQTLDTDPAETQEWLESLEYVIKSKGEDRAKYILSMLEAKARLEGVDLPMKSNTPYINTIATKDQPPYPGNRELERRIKNYVRWNAFAMVVKANKKNDGIGGHISTFASSATLYEVAFNHVFRGRGESGYDGDQIYFQGHASPGMYSRAFMEGRLNEDNLNNFRLELQDVQGLSSYPHPWLMPNFWEYPTVSMGLGPIMAIYQARFNEYLKDRGLKDTTNLDNLKFIINCNLQRLDGPVRGNGKIMQELEALFRGAGWNVIKVVWGDDWDPLLEQDELGLLVKRMGEVIDGQYQKYVGMPGSYIREHFFGKHPELLEMVKSYSDEKLLSMRRGGHDPEKVWAAYKAAMDHKGQPTVILAKTIKGYGLGESGEGRNVAHNLKKANEEELIQFRSRFSIPLSDEEVVKAPFYKPADNSPEMQYLKERREAMGGPVPLRPTEHPTMEVPTWEDVKDKTLRDCGETISTTMGIGRLMSNLCRDKKIGKNIVPIVPDESRTFGIEAMFRQVGIYSHVGQLYDPIDSKQVSYYKEAKNGQLLEEGISEAGAMSSFNAAGTAYSAHGINMIPMFIYYSMFGFQRIGDLIWAAADMRAKGFLFGGTAGRTSLNGEGLQHQDGHSLLNAIAFPTVRAFDPAFHYESNVIIMDGLKKLYQEGDTAIYYLMCGTDAFEMPNMPEGCEEGIINGIYKFRSKEAAGAKHRVQLFGSGAIMQCVLKAQEMLAEQFGISSDVWSVTSYTQLRRDAASCQRWNMLHPTEAPKKSYIETVLEGHEGPFIASSDYVKALAEQVAPFVPGDFFALGTDGMGRSETRPALRRHFEVDAESIIIATLTQLMKQGKATAEEVAKAIKDLGYDTEKINPLYA